jgi:mobilome CxxCx(11)CxxC protein
MQATPQTDQICKESWDRALYAYGTGTLFADRARKYRKGLRWLAFIGIAGPLLIGGIVLAFKANAAYLEIFLFVVGVVGIIQLLVSAWSLTSNWADNLEYSLSSSSDNLELSPLFKALGQSSSSPPADIEVQFAALKARDEARRKIDVTKNISEKEKRYAHRAGLLQFNRECSGCKQTPTSMTPSDCGICGRF